MENYYENETCAMNFENTLASSIIFTTAFVGFICNIAAAFFLLYLPNLRNAFGILMDSHAIASACILTRMFLYDAPIILFVACSFAVSPLGFVISSSINYFWYAAVFGQVAIAFNRCLAISSPMKYRRLFTNRNAVFITIVPWLVAFVMVIWGFWGCAMWVDPLLWRPNAPDTECNRTMDRYGFYGDNLFVIIILLLDGYTMYRLREFSKRLNSTATGGSAAQIAEKQRQRQEIRFFFQAFATDMFLVLNQFNSGVARFWMTDAGKWPSFIVANIPFIVQHFIDALLILLINPEIRTKLFQRKTRKTSVIGITRIAPSDRKASKKTTPMSERPSKSAPASIPITNPSDLKNPSKRL